MDRRIWTNFIGVAVISGALQLDVEFTKKADTIADFCLVLN